MFLGGGGLSIFGAFQLRTISRDGKKLEAEQSRRDGSKFNRIRKMSGGWLCRRTCEFSMLAITLQFFAPGLDGPVSIANTTHYLMMQIDGF